ncbi:MAG TPA: nitrilase family protein [Porphyromonadaceae bacterium]|nr:nitrilase family protein [Porphyromonadaceae bacterium]
MKTFKVCVIPLNITWGNKDANLVTAAHELNQVEKDTDLVVIPELFSTDFVNDGKLVATLAETNDGHTMDAVKRWVSFFGVAIAGSFLATDGTGHYFNRAFFVEPSGDVTFYDKHHLFPLSHEDKIYTAGNHLSPVIRYRGWNIKLMVCYDIRFPVWCRNGEEIYDILVVPSNWPHARIFQYHQLLSARAIENQIFTIGANRTGRDNYGEYPAGDSAIFDNLGSRIGETRRNGHIYSIFDREELDAGRHRFPAWRDSDKFTIDL